MERLCAYCGNPFPEEEMQKIDDGLYCQNCVENHAIECEHCGEFHMDQDMFERVRVGRFVYDNVCNDCLQDEERYYRCNDCGEMFDGEYTSRIDTEDGCVCHRCYEDDYVVCDECGRIIHRNRAYYNDWTENYYCEECNEGRNNIKNYSYKPAPKCKTMQHDYFNTPEDIKELLFGIENEIDRGDNPYDTAAQIAEQSEDVYIKHDGSLGSSGMEIVTHPCTCEYHIKKLGWGKICQAAKDNGYISHDARTCGLHIHVGIHQLGETNEERKKTMAKIVVLVDRHWDFMKKFSRRRESQLEHWAMPPKLGITSGRYSEKEIEQKALETEERGRYQAINLQNSNTIEFRLFNGSLLPSTIFATIQLVRNICEYCKLFNMESVLRSEWKDFVNLKYYPELQSYIKGRGMEEMESPEPVALRGEYVDKEEVEFKENSIVKLVSNRGGYDQSVLLSGIGEIGRVVGEAGNGKLLIEFARRFTNYLWDSGIRNLSNLYEVEEQNLELVMA